MALFTLAVDSRPWWQVMHRFIELSPLSTDKPLGKVTFDAVRRAYVSRFSWQLVHARPFCACAEGSFLPSRR